MNTGSWILVALVATCLPLYIFWRAFVAQHKAYASNIAIFNDRLNTAQRLYLETLRREIANIILSRDIEAFEKTFDTMVFWEDGILKAGKEVVAAENTILMNKFPDLHDFDLIASRHCIRYEIDGASFSFDDLIERYKELSKFLCIGAILLSISPKERLYSDREVSVFRKHVQTLKDYRLKTDIEEAMARFYIFRRDRESALKQYDDTNYFATCLLGQPGRSFTPEIEYGILCKERNEFGIYSFFVGDDKTYYSYSRSDDMFKTKNSLAF